MRMRKNANSHTISGSETHVSRDEAQSSSGGGIWKKFPDLFALTLQAKIQTEALPLLSLD